MRGFLAPNQMLKPRRLDIRQVCIQTDYEEWLEESGYRGSRPVRYA